MAGVRSTVCVFQPLKYVTGVTILREPNGKTESFTSKTILICPKLDMPFMPRKQKASLESYHIKCQKYTL